MIKCDLGFHHLASSSFDWPTVSMPTLRSFRLQWVFIKIPEHDERVGSFLARINAPLVEDLALIARGDGSINHAPIKSIISSPSWNSVLDNLQKLSLTNQNLTRVNFGEAILSRCLDLKELQVDSCLGLDQVIRFYAEEVESSDFKVPRIQTLPLQRLGISSGDSTLPTSEWKDPLVKLVTAGVEYGSLEAVILSLAALLGKEERKQLGKLK